MASPLQTGKESVNLAANGAPGSRIRRDPPPAVKQLIVRDPEGRDARMVVIGIATFALSLFIIAIGFSSFIGWSPSDYTVRIEGQE